VRDKKRLGRGLEALIPDLSPEKENDIKEISLDKIKPNPYQPRINFDDEKLRELADSIKEHGVVQAIVVSPADGEFILVAGERRYRAAQLVGLPTIPAVVRKYNKRAMLEIALIENLQREDLTPIEEGEAYRRLIDEFNLTQEELSLRIGKSRSAIANTIRLLSLPEVIKDALCRGDITAGQARPLLGLPDNETREKAATQIITRGMTAREVENMVADTVKRKRLPGFKVLPEADPHLKETQIQLQRRLGTKVKMIKGKQGGSLEIYFYSDEDLVRLLMILLPDGIS
jgi:ParB family chromosome partitioning protein